MWTYPPEFLASLAGLGLAPRPATPPSIVRAALNDLYRFELRRERDRLRSGAIEKSDYLGIVVALRRKYWLLTFQPAHWDRICQPTAPPVEP